MGTRSGARTRDLIHTHPNSNIIYWVRQLFGQSFNNGIFPQLR